MDTSAVGLISIDLSNYQLDWSLLGNGNLVKFIYIRSRSGLETILEYAASLHLFPWLFKAVTADRPTVRCALTFLSITCPGISKRCERCGKEFLKEQVEPTEEGLTTNNEAETSANMADRSPSLASWLFRRFDVCPYCGGKYVG